MSKSSKPHDGFEVHTQVRLGVVPVSGPPVVLQSAGRKLMGWFRVPPVTVTVAGDANVAGGFDAAAQLPANEALSSYL